MSASASRDSQEPQAPAETPPNPDDPKARRRRALRFALQLLGTTAGFLYIGLSVDLGSVADSVQALPPSAFLAAVGLSFVGLFVGAARWRVLLRAYGAPKIPPFGRLAALYFVGFFYNTYLPGGVGGDVVRGVVTRESFGDGGATRALTVVLVERVLGLGGLLALVAAILAVAPPRGMEGVAGFAALGVVATLVGVACIAFARRLGPKLPGALGRLASSLPELAHAPSFVLAFAMSLLTQSIVGLGGYAILSGLTDALSMGDAFVLAPLASATAFLPFTVGGAGAREAAFVFVGEKMGLAAADATAASLLVWAAQLVVAAMGGLVQLVRRR
ncbi:MAG: flippase-like domain-containing protein [Sandaracinus sp.]|nr:flippase-like domain-containing protein [Myxococcales bacterium]MCB9622696.1 flippase-like domain-containing protein [Sandaracinus sp.]MCB9635664.1 flippase-like domain-containing protein [Sandaracinus sp.]